MGAYSPAPVVTDEIHRRVMREVMEPTVRGLIADGTPYVGFLYAGLMIAPTARRTCSSSIAASAIRKRSRS